MGNIITGIAMGISWCFCSACCSLFSSCLGNDKSSSETPTATSGRKRSVFLLVTAVSLAFAFQYGLAPVLSPDTNASYVPKVGTYLVRAWNDGCDDLGSDALRDQCRGNSGALRASASSSVFFVLAALGSFCRPTANREAWVAKYTLFLFLAAGSVFVPNRPVFYEIYLQFARVGSVVFIFLQQIILIDLAYNLNESWVANAEEAETEERGSGTKWLAAILASCCVLFLGSFTVIVLLFVYFRGCSENEAFISITLVMSLVLTATQLCSEEGSLLASAVITSYATYLNIIAVTKNPNGACNPRLGKNDVLGITLGVAFTVLSLAWTGWSYTAESKMQNNRNDYQGQQEGSQTQKSIVKGVVTNTNDQDYGSRDNGSADEPLQSSETDGTSLQTWKINIVLLLISCWFGMALTGWGSIEHAGSAADPLLSKTSMWMIISSQWVVMLLYLWTLVAPKLFPDRDFS